MSWIPVEERLPEDREYLYYMVQLTDGDIVPAYKYRGKWHSCLGIWVSVAAWQERPAPYVKPRRFVVVEESLTTAYNLSLDDKDRLYSVRDAYPRGVVASAIPTREAAEKIADIYEEVYGDT